MGAQALLVGEMRMSSSSVTSQAASCVRCRDNHHACVRCRVGGSDVTAATAACLANSLDLAAALTQGSNDETVVAAASAPVTVALAALMDCRAAGLVVALSCEAARRDTTTFDMPASGDVLSAKDEADVAADIKVLVFGSMVVGAAEGALAAAATFAKVPVSGVDGVTRSTRRRSPPGRARRRRLRLRRFRLQRRSPVLRTVDLPDCRGSHSPPPATPGRRPAWAPAPSAAPPAAVAAAQLPATSLAGALRRTARRVRLPRSPRRGPAPPPSRFRPSPSRDFALACPCSCAASPPATSPAALRPRGPLQRQRPPILPPRMINGCRRRIWRGVPRAPVAHCSARAAYGDSAAEMDRTGLRSSVHDEISGDRRCWRQTTNRHGYLRRRGAHGPRQPDGTKGGGKSADQYIVCERLRLCYFVDFDFFYRTATDAGKPPRPLLS
ncbi:uncharacterized protein [Miscanthus floridulus]|uniref:uncharacterized protein n=1 Tax=Miscanthus floridulus TaxID=154761 RepID=UPI003457463C